MGDDHSSAEDILQAERLLDELISELAAGCRIAEILSGYSTTDMEFDQIRRHYLVLIMISLSKLLEFFSRFGTTLSSDCLPAARNLVKELERRRIPAFRNGFLGKLWNRKKQRPVWSQSLDRALEEIVESDESAFFKWIGCPDGEARLDNVIGILNQIRDGLKKRHGMDGSGLF